MYNKESGYGKFVPQFLSQGVAGKTFVVGKAGIASLDMYREIFGGDPDGKLRLFSTLDEAVGNCTANAGDTIYVLPGHTEDVTTTSIALDVAGINIVCLGSGTNRPTFTYGAAAATITVSAANISWKGGLFVGNFDNVAAAFTVTTAKYFKLEGATFNDNSASLHFLSIVVTNATDNAADGLNIVGNSWYGMALAPNAFISILAAEKDVLITDNYVNMLATNDVGHFLTVAAKVQTNLRVLRNTLIVVGATTATVGVFMTGSSTTNTGTVAYNLVNSLDTTTELIITAALNLALFENYYTGTITASGKLWPAVDAA